MLSHSNLLSVSSTPQAPLSLFCDLQALCISLHISPINTKPSSTFRCRSASSRNHIKPTCPTLADGRRRNHGLGTGRAPSGKIDRVTNRAERSNAVVLPSICSVPPTPSQNGSTATPEIWPISSEPSSSFNYCRLYSIGQLFMSP